MKTIIKSATLFSLLLLASCGGKEGGNEESKAPGNQIAIDSASIKEAVEKIEDTSSEIKEDAEELDSLLNELE